MSCVRRQRRAIAWLAIVALVSNVVGAFAPAKGLAAAADPLGSIVICTADGAKMVHGDGSSDGQAALSGHCPACRLLVAFVLPAPILDAGMAFRVEAVSLPVPAVAGVLPIALRLGGIRSRAPPLSA
jgi:hypothetical protein